MVSECIIDFVKKYKKYIVVICIVFALIFLWKFTHRQENAEGNNSGNSTSLGGAILYCCGTLLCGCILPLIIMYFITKSAAKAAIESTPCRTITTESVSV